MDRDIYREKQNTYICLNPYLNPEQERIGTEARAAADVRPDQHMFRMRKARIEGSLMAPTYVEDNLKHLKHNVTWE